MEQISEPQNPNELWCGECKIAGVFTVAQKILKTSEGGENDPFAKPLYGLTAVPRVRIPPSPPEFLPSSIPARRVAERSAGHHGHHTFFVLPLYIL